MIKITPIELESIINAAFLEIARYPEDYKLTEEKTYEIFRWLVATDWDNPEEECIMIDEVPF